MMVQLSYENRVPVHDTLVTIHFPCATTHTGSPMTHLEDLDLTWRRMQQLVLPVVVRVCFYLDSEGHTFLATVFLGSELCADGVNFEVEPGLFRRVPYEVSLVDFGRVKVHVHQAVWQRDVCGETGRFVQGSYCPIPKLNVKHFVCISFIIHCLASPFCTLSDVHNHEIPQLSKTSFPTIFQDHVNLDRRYSYEWHTHLASEAKVHWSCKHVSWKLKCTGIWRKSMMVPEALVCWSLQQTYTGLEGGPFHSGSGNWSML